MVDAGSYKYVEITNLKIIAMYCRKKPLTIEYNNILKRKLLNRYSVCKVTVKDVECPTNARSVHLWRSKKQMIVKSGISALFKTEISHQKLVVKVIQTSDFSLAQIQFCKPVPALLPKAQYWTQPITLTCV